MDKVVAILGNIWKRTTDMSTVEWGVLIAVIVGVWFFFSHPILIILGVVIAWFASAGFRTWVKGIIAKWK